MHLWQEEKIQSKSLSQSVMEMGLEEGKGDGVLWGFTSAGLRLGALGGSGRVLGPCTLGAGRAAGLDVVCGSPKCCCLAVRQTPKVFTPLRSKKSGNPVQLVMFLFLFFLCLILVNTSMSGEATFF